MDDRLGHIMHVTLSVTCVSAKRLGDLLQRRLLLQPFIEIFL